jgi:RNA polymerase sigma-32 factor
MGTGLQRVDMLVPGANLDAYIQTVNGIPILTIEEERELTDKLYQEGDLEAARRLVMSHLRFTLPRAIPVTAWRRLT